MKTEVFFLIGLLCMVLLVSGCTDPKPNFSFNIDKTALTIEDNSTSTFVTATVKRLDNTDTPVIVTLKLSSMTPEMIYPVDASGRNITQLQTKTLEGKGSQDTLQFKVFGLKKGLVEAKSQIDIAFWYDNEPVPENKRSISILVR